VASGDPAERIRLRRPGPVDATTFNQIHLAVTFVGVGGLSAAFLRDGVVEHVTEPVAIPVQGEPTLVVLEVPESAREQGRYDAIVLECVGTERNLGLRRVALVDAPRGATLPDPGAGPQLVRAGEDVRRGVGVVEGRPVVADVDVPDGGLLGFSYAFPKPKPAGTFLVVTLTAGDEQVQHVFAGARQDVWRQATIPLDAFVRRRLSVRFAVASPDGTGSAACVVAEPSVWRPSARPPTVLLLTSDTHRGDHLGVAPDGAGVSTPVLDALAEGGLYFSDCFAPANYTLPSHVALLTGTSPRDTGVLNNYQPLADGARTLAEAFREAGWATMACVSAPHLSDEGGGLGQGFDRMSWPVDGAPRDAPATLAVAERWLAEVSDRPLFLWLHVFDAHMPYEPEDEWVAPYYEVGRDPYDPAFAETGPAPAVLPELYADVHDMEWPRALYKAEVSQLDSRLANVLDRAQRRGALVAVVGDHGEGLGERGVYFEHIGLYTTLHVPLIVAGPGVPAGVRSDLPVAHMDLGRTLLDLAGLSHVSFPGRNLVDAAQAPSPRALPRFALEGWGLSAAVTSDGIHLVLNLSDEQPGGEPVLLQEHHEVELYDLRVDPACAENLVDARPEEARRLRSMLLAWLASRDDKGWAGSAVSDPERIEALRRLGYVGSAPDAQETDGLWTPDACDWCRRFED
jgi:arylsulfatase A-like enzyme